MTTTTRALPPTDFIQRGGLVVDRASAFIDAGGRIVATRRREYAVVPGGRAYPLHCGDIVLRWGEDGSYDDRCHNVVAPFDDACRAHAEARDWWRSLSEHERCAVERAEDELR